MSRPLNGAILIGGKSRRMGTPKALLTVNDETLLDRAINVVRPIVQGLVLVGKMPEGLSSPTEICVLPDAIRMRGPLGGILAALRHDSRCDWLIVACDMPRLAPESIRWLIDNHSAASSATVGIHEGDFEPQPFPGIYTTYALAAIERSIQDPKSSMRSALQLMKADIKRIPSEFASMWQNINTPAEWDEFRSKLD